MRKFVLTLFTLFISVVSLSAQTAEEEIRTLLVTRDTEIKELIGPEGTELDSLQREQLKNIVNGIIDFESMASHALGATYNVISEEQRDEYVSLFTTILKAQSLGRLDIYRADIIYEEITVDGNTATVNTVAAMEDARVPVSYEMRNNGSEWLITDLIIDQVSTSESNHTQFQSVIRQRGFDALLESFRRTAAKV